MPLSPKEVEIMSKRARVELRHQETLVATPVYSVWVFDLEDKETREILLRRLRFKSKDNDLVRPDLFTWKARMVLQSVKETLTERGVEFESKH